ncbi:unnamed protein product [Microthlaspi erraticum]|uniref:Uncharacterized protein n=1 Tax=Microthlaspi erraticum TaxID=1685480 RepID=A0A6D2JW24_9BRAS|nr:unnamed protein product [Microthlaspi erraticum]
MANGKKKKRILASMPHSSKFARVLAIPKSRIPKMSSHLASDLETPTDAVATSPISVPEGENPTSHCLSSTSDASQQNLESARPEEVDVSAIDGNATSDISVPTPTTQTEKPPLSPPRKWASVIHESSQLEELGTPAEHVSGAPFVFIPDENLEEAKEEFKEFIFARFHGDAPEMGRIIGIVNAL